ncbi:polysaccharide export outer membrane protein [Yoonia maritima]|uniref:Polysaccharide export outer membrane protein n=1 Tax=Yoonia maritima TaxID=1435347 RepID=A0A2T0VZK6_9RHOB|nr:polysaccharide biosynthesis/export family protein [Yoonia maritima]PRY77751.1 polysaccharide export outer membrane protein [Yoonia maritima]
MPLTRLKSFSRYGGCVFLALVLAGCSSLPAFGPSTDEIVEAAAFEVGTDEAVTQFHLVNVTAATLPQSQVAVSRFPNGFRAQRFLVENERISVADVLELRIWETANDGLFASSGQRETVLSFQVSNAGTIEVPYAGRINVAGLTTSRVRQVLLEKYQGQAIDPEINVRITDTSSRTAIVLGDVRTSGRADIPANGIRLLDLLAQMGGVPHPTWEAEIAVSRGMHSGRMRMDDLKGHAADNIVILPGDTVQVTHVPRRYAVYGAVSRTGNTNLNTANPTLSDLLAEVGGLNDMQAAPNSVFVFRRARINTETPIVYRVDFARADAFLLADQFMLKETDIIYVATADASEFRKFVATLIGPVVSSANSVQSLGN